jgi:hypothetical protein
VKTPNVKPNQSAEKSFGSKLGMALAGSKNRLLKSGSPVRYADLFSDEEQGSTARSLEPPARVEEGASRERSHDANTLRPFNRTCTLPAHLKGEPKFRLP